MDTLKGKNKFIGLTVVGILLIIPSIGSGQETYFYDGKNYGSESSYNPLSLILNSSYDVIQFNGMSRNIASYSYRNGFSQVADNLLHPFDAIRDYGVKDFFLDQILPVNFTPGHGQWWANYHLHLFGGGMTYVKMSEWYAFHGFAHPKTYSLITMAAYHFLNEAVENNDHRGYNVDPIADIYVFDIGGILLFSNDEVKRFFSSTLHVNDWSLQPSFSLRSSTLYNNGQYFSLKWKIPSIENFYFFYLAGVNGLFGISYSINREEMISVATGYKAQERITLDEKTNRQTVRLRGNFGVFYDKNNSLLASLLLFDSYNDAATINIYPGMLKFGSFSPGFFLILERNGMPIAGITTRWTPGIAVVTY